MIRLFEPFGSGDWQLYDLAKDPGELNDLSTERRELRDEMVGIWEAYSREIGVVLPSPNLFGPQSR